MGGGGGRGHIASLLSVSPYVRKMVSGRYLLKTLVYWIHIEYTGIIIKYRSSSIYPLIIIRVMDLDLLRKMVSVGVFDSYFIHRYKIFKYKSSSIKDKIH